MIRRVAIGIMLLMAQPATAYHRQYYRHYVAPPVAPKVNQLPSKIAPPVVSKSTPVPEVCPNTSDPRDRALCMIRIELEKHKREETGK